jgi:hypothetical protein
MARLVVRRQPPRAVTTLRQRSRVPLMPLVKDVILAGSVYSGWLVWLGCGLGAMRGTSQCLAERLLKIEMLGRVGQRSGTPWLFWRSVVEYKARFRNTTVSRLSAGLRLTTSARDVLLPELNFLLRAAAHDQISDLFDIFP